MRSETVVLPASMWAIIPIFLYFSNGYFLGIPGSRTAILNHNDFFRNSKLIYFLLFMNYYLPNDESLIKNYYRSFTTRHNIFSNNYLAK